MCQRHASYFLYSLYVTYLTRKKTTLSSITFDQAEREKKKSLKIRKSFMRICTWMYVGGKDLFYTTYHMLFVKYTATYRSGVDER